MTLKTLLVRLNDEKTSPVAIGLKRNLGKLKNLEKGVEEIKVVSLKDARRHINDSKYDLVVFDDSKTLLNLPEETTGQPKDYDLAKRIREVNPSAVIVVTVDKLKQSSSWEYKLSSWDYKLSLDHKDYDHSVEDAIEGFERILADSGIRKRGRVKQMTKSLGAIAFWSLLGTCTAAEVATCGNTKEARKIRSDAVEIIVDYARRRADAPERNGRVNEYRSLLKSNGYSDVDIHENDRLDIYSDDGGRAFVRVGERNYLLDINRLKDYAKFEEMKGEKKDDR